MSATEPNSKLLRFPVGDRDEVEFCVPEGIDDAENLLPIILHDDALGFGALGTGGKVLVHEGIRGGDGELHAMRLPDGKVVVRRLVRLDIDRVRLEAAHPGYEHFEFFEYQIEIIGVVVRDCLNCMACQSSAPGHVIVPAEATPCVPTNIWSAIGADISPTIPCPIMTWQTDARGVVTYTNRMCREFLGLTEAEIQAGAWKGLIHPDDRVDYLRYREKAIAESETYQNSVRILNWRGEYSLLSIILAPFWDEHGRVTAWHAVAQLAEGLHRQSA